MVDQPSEILRAAAQRLRKLGSKAATPGPWSTCGGGNHEGQPHYPYCAKCGSTDSHILRLEDHVWITTMSPALAEPLAAWLDLEAIQAAIGAWPDDLPNAAQHYALTVARLILGENR